jgi:hypothetical protein
MTRTGIALLALLVFTVAPIAAQDSVRMTQDEAVARALETSHRLAEANARVTGAQAAIRLPSSRRSSCRAATRGPITSTSSLYRGQPACSA